MKRCQTIFIAFTGIFPFMTFGHHSESAFDTESIVVLTGDVTSFSWRNPHVYIGVRTSANSGESVDWVIETGATPLLVRSGWTSDSLEPRDRIIARVHPSKDSGRRYALLLELEKEDGTVLEQRIDASRMRAKASDLSGVWKGSGPAFGGFLEQFGALPLTPAGIAARDRYDMNAENPAAACVAYPTPATLVATFAFLSEIDLGDDIVVIRNEWFDAERVVYMDGRSHPESGERTVQGHSIGWWEGDTLVVDTTRFADHRSPYQNGVPSGAMKHVIERFTLSEDGTALSIEVFMEDPEYLAEPFTTTIDWNYRPDLELLRFGCDPGVSSQYIP